MGDFEDTLNQILSSPQAMEQIMSLASSIAGAPGEASGQTPPDGPAQSGAPAPADLLSGLDPGMLGKVMELLAVYRQDGGQREQLLAALKPFLRPERQARLEQAVRITRISRVIRAALSMGGGDV